MVNDILAPKQAYDLWSQSYDEGANPMVALVVKTLAELTDVPSSVLEMGCGTGRNLGALSARGVTQLYGFDLSPGMLSVANDRLGEANLWAQDMLEPTPLEDGSVEMVLISLVLEHVENPEQAFAEAARLLKTGGRLIILELHPELYAAGSRAKFHVDGQAFHTAAWSHTAADFRRFASGAGLGDGDVVDLFPDAALEALFPSEKRAGRPWLLRGTWVKT